MALKVGVVGALGYAGIEVVRIVCAHPDMELSVVTAGADAGKRIDEVYPALRGTCSLELTSHDDAALASCDLVFLAVPHTKAMPLVPSLLDAGVSVFDLSADYRLSDVEVYERWYAAEHTSPDLLETRTFGLPEVFRADIESAAAARAAGKAVLVACAGCYPTASSLAAWPAVTAGLHEGTLVVDAISGVTGAGRSCNARTHYCHADENVEAYGVTKHRHTPEIEQILGLPDRLVFTPHLAPYRRGLLATVYVNLPETHPDLPEIHELYRKAYEGRPFVDVLPLGEFPGVQSVAGTNVCRIGLAMDERTGTLVAVSAIDNLCKGAAGQAVQCANLVFGLDEAAGLSRAGLPV